MEDRVPVGERVRATAERIGRAELVAACCALLAGAPREDHVEVLRGLTGAAWEPGGQMFDRAPYPDHWPRTWGARGLLHVWDDSATPSVVAGLADEHHRPAEMCLKVATRHEVAGTADGAARLAAHELPRVRVQAMRCLAVAGDVEHLEVVRAALDDDRADVRAHAERALERMTRRLDA